MAKVTIGGREYDIAPYKIASLRKAAPYIDRVNAVAGSLTTLAGMAEVAGDFIAILAVGIVKIDPAMTAEALEELIGIDDVTVLRDGFRELMVESGIVSGEAPALPVAEPEGALMTASEPLSTS